jgi:hypothetical protein
MVAQDTVSNTNGVWFGNGEPDATSQTGVVVRNFNLKYYRAREWIPENQILAQIRIGGVFPKVDHAPLSPDVGRVVVLFKNVQIGEQGCIKKCSGYLTQSAPGGRPEFSIQYNRARQITSIQRRFADDALQGKNLARLQLHPANLTAGRSHVGNAVLILFRKFGSMPDCSLEFSDNVPAGRNCGRPGFRIGKVEIPPARKVTNTDQKLSDQFPADAWHGIHFLQMSG